ncbi:zinc-ribbon domain-containing protein [Metallosphaera sp.]|uniref:zinc ribbon domain-containing protein n=1 Tax=Metallosphaera sp. TaxID=2020860 RepID=UPI00316833B8
MIRCPRCGYENPDEVNFCERCRYPLSSNLTVSTKCPRCGYENAPNAEVCERCRYPLRVSSFKVENEEKPSKEPYLRVKDGALYLTIGVFFLILSMPSINFLIQNVLSFVSVIFLGLGTGSYSLGFRLLGEKGFKGPSLSSFLLLPGFLLLLSGIGVVELNVTKLNLSDLSKNPLAVALIDLGFLLFLIGGIGITVGVYRLSKILNRQGLRLGSIVSLVGFVSFILFPELGFLLIGGQFLIFLELRTILNEMERKVT